MAYKKENYDDLSRVSPAEDISTNKIFMASKNLKYPNRFTVSQDILTSIVGACQERTFSEEVDLLESYGSNISSYYKANYWKYEH